MSYRKESIDLSATAYNAENCEDACTAMEPGDCTYFAFTEDSCTLYSGQCTENQGDAESDWHVYKRMQSCYWTTPLLIHEDSACDNQADLMADTVIEFTQYTLAPLGYDVQTCHEACQEGDDC
jgi:hypothetical protein